MDKQLRQLERQARQTNSPEDMFALFRAYRKIYPSSFATYKDIPIKQTCNPFFYEEFNGFKAKMELLISRKRFTLDVECHENQTLAFLLESLLGTSTVAATQGEDIDLSEMGSGTTFSRNAVHLFLTWDSDRDGNVPILRFARHRYNKDCHKDILGMVMIANHQYGNPSPIIVEKDEPALLLSVLPWVQSWCQENYHTILEWELISTEASFLHGEETLQKLEKRLKDCQESILATQVGLGRDVFHRMKIKSGIL
jgi:hypothetical protein